MMMWPATDRCPECGNDMQDLSNPEGSRLIGVEISRLYDGVLYWQCPDCGHRWNRFPRDHYLWPRAQRWLGHINYVMGER